MSREFNAGMDWAITLMKMFKRTEDMMNRSELLSINVTGNWHGVVEWCNKWELADYVIGANYNGGGNTTVLLRVPKGFNIDLHYKTVGSGTSQHRDTPIKVELNVEETEILLEAISEYRYVLTNRETTKENEELQPKLAELSDRLRYLRSKR